MSGPDAEKKEAMDAAALVAQNRSRFLDAKSGTQAVQTEAEREAERKRYQEIVAQMSEAGGGGGSFRDSSASFTTALDYEGVADLRDFGEDAGAAATASAASAASAAGAAASASAASAANKTGSPYNPKEPSKPYELPDLVNAENFKQSHSSQREVGCLPD